MRSLLAGFGLLLLLGCDNSAMNNPHQAQDADTSVGYSSFSEPPKTLDPAKSYSADEYLFIAQIYEPLLQYHFLKRPYTLIPLTTKAMPEVTFLSATGEVLAKETPSEKIAFTRYDIHLQPGIHYQPHPAFAKDAQGNYRYHGLQEEDLEGIEHLSDFEYRGTHELVANDYVYQMKRLANPRLHSPIYGLMKKYIVGLSQLHDQLARKNSYIDLRQYTLKGVKVIDDYHFQITINGKYPQFIYWLAMPFFSPIPWEVDYFYSQPGMKERNLVLSWYPVGTGPYYLSENNPNRQMVLTKNPHFHGETFPSEGMPGDKEAGYLELAGKPLPMVDRYIYSLEKESIPRWNKFLQGYYDLSAISSDSFDQAIQVDSSGEASLTPEMKAKKINLRTMVGPSISYLGFNMLDTVVGGKSESAKKIRQALTIALDYDEYIAIFMNGRGLVAQGPLPPGIFGYDESPNPLMQKNLTEAKQLLAEAGYPNGVNAKTGEPLVLNYDVTSTSGPDDNARFDWFRKQFAKIGIQLNIRSTQYNRFQKKIRTGDVQIFSWGWNADYPDPENFLFLLYGPNGKVKSGGENAANYSNPEFNRLFEAMKNKDNGPERKAIIEKMIALVQDDAPWIFGVFPKSFVLSHHWMATNKLNPLANNTLKYTHIDTQQRQTLRAQWNKPITWPISAGIGGFVLLTVPVVVSYWRKQYRARRQG